VVATENNTLELKREIKRGEDLFAQGEIEKAEKLFLKLLKEAPQNAEILNNLGVICHTLGRFPDGIGYFRDALEADPHDQDALENLLALYEEKKLWKEVVVVLEKTLALDSTNHELLNRLALAQMESGDRDGAIRSLKQSHGLNPGQRDLMGTLGILEQGVERDSASDDNKTSQADIVKNNSSRKDLDKKDELRECILLIDFNPNTNTHNIANILNQHKYSVDLAYSGRSPLPQLPPGTNPYRKLLGINDLLSLINYAKFYNYQNIHIFNTPSQFKSSFRANGLSFSEANLSGKSSSEIASYFNLNKVIHHKKYVSFSSNKISIIIPTYNRPYYLERVLAYLNSYKNITPVIIVLDSSHNTEMIENINTIKKYNTTQYKHFPSDIRPLQKLIKGVEFVTTDYLALCADDDFLTEEGVIESIKILDKDRSLYSVKGKNLFFTTSMDNLIEYDWFSGLESSDCIERLEAITKGFFPSLIYQVFRTDQFKRMYSFMGANSDLFPRNDTFGEYLYYFIVVATGKIGKLSLDLNIRDKGVPRETEVKNFPHAVVEGIFNDDYKKFVEYLGAYINILGLADTQRFYNKIPDIFGNFLIHFLQVPKDNVIYKNDGFDIQELETGMRKSWVWPANL